ncbi:hypothetical protein ILUMI_00661 [Ignelater luminosus]|uniref:Uncharacterized protein n=1 Tax=Ignelater luminosus TaxID=2038154 RepID=A0A8K0DS81_IGNLU|nr:hypothetical protein ILUMI_00661 [Ignelater luminosus]
MRDVYTSDSSSNHEDWSDSDSQEDVFVNAVRAKNENFFEITVSQYDKDVFREHFRMSRAVVNGLTARFHNSDAYKY